MAPTGGEELPLTLFLVDQPTLITFNDASDADQVFIGGGLPDPKIVFAEREQQFEVFPIVERMFEGRAFVDCVAGEIADRDRIRFQFRSAMALPHKVKEVRDQSIADIDHGVNRDGLVKLLCEGHAGIEGEMMSVNALSQRTGDADEISRSRPVTHNRALSGRGSDDGDVDRQFLIPGCRVSPGQLHVELARQFKYARMDFLNGSHRHRLWDGDTDEACDRLSGHRRDIGEIDGERFAPRQPRAALFQLEMGAIENHIGGDQQFPRKRFTEHRRVITDAAIDVGITGRFRAQPVDEIEFGAG